MRIKVFADSKESLDDTLRFLKCYALATDAIPPIDPASLVRTHRDIDALKSSGAFTAAFGRAVTSKEPLESRSVSNGADMAQTLISYLKKPPEEIDEAFSASRMQPPASPAMARPTMEGTLYDTAIDIPAENPIIDHYALSKGMFVARDEEKGTAIYSSIELAVQQGNRMTVMQRVEEIMQYADPLAQRHS